MNSLSQYKNSPAIFHIFGIGSLILAIVIGLVIITQSANIFLIAVLLLLLFLLLASLMITFYMRINRLAYEVKDAEIKGKKLSNRLLIIGLISLLLLMASFFVILAYPDKFSLLYIFFIVLLLSLVSLIAVFIKFIRGFKKLRSLN